MHNEISNHLTRYRVLTGLAVLAVVTTIVGTNTHADKAVSATTAGIADSPPISSLETVGLDVYRATSASSIASYVSFIGIAGAISGSTSNPATPDVKGIQKQ